jgi:uncharacterized membrane protein
MVKNEMSIIINRPIEEVFAYVSNLQNGPQWQTGLFEVRRITQGSLGIGSQFASVRKFLGRKLEANVEIVAYEPNRKIVIKSPSGSVPFEQSFLFEPVADGTRLATLIELHTSGFMGLAEPMIAGSLKREMEAAFGDLKDLLETRVPAVTS